jgi:molybdate/tungstate transport system substrate-binding protein
MYAAWLIIGLIVGGLVGSAVTYYYAPSKATTTSSYYAAASSTPFSVGAAGTLQYAWGSLLNNTFAKLYPNIKYASLFEGSGAVATTEAATKQFSIEAAADTSVIPTNLFTNITDYQIAFGETQVVIIINLASTPGKDVYSMWQTAQSETVLSSQWNQTWQQIFTTIALSNAVVGVSNPFTDPSGYQGAGMIRLAGLAFFGNVSRLYDAIYNNPSRYVMRDTETDLVTLAESGQVDFITSAYRSNAISQVKNQPNLAYITLPNFINLGDVAQLNYYYQGNFKYTEQGTTNSYTLNPVVYCLTIPKPSTNPNAATLFVLTLWSPAGQATLEKNGITPLMPSIIDGNGNSVPSILLPYTVMANSTTSQIFPTGG